MRRIYRGIIAALIVVGVTVVAGVCWHSIEEIHYLKSFYPRAFTVEQAFYASAVELIKVLIVSVPVAFVAGVGFGFLRQLGFS